MTKHAISSPVTFVTHKCFAVLFFLLSCCLNSVLMGYDSIKMMYFLETIIDILFLEN